jgi:Flp pilus assembly protein TadD
MEKVTVKNNRPDIGIRGSELGKRLRRKRGAGACAALTLMVGILAANAGIAAAQIPAAGLAAEGERRWQDAIQIYESIVREHPERADLWLRLSDIRAALGETDASLQALHTATRTIGNDPDLFARLSRAYATAGQPQAALAAIEGALALRPSDPAFLKARGELASWNGKYTDATASYRQLLEITPDDASAWLALARVMVWDGATDQSARAYSEYVRLQPDDLAGWIEWARAESWRGNDAGALRVLDRCRAQFGETREYRRELASVLTRGGRPGRALSVVRPLLAGNPEDYELNLLEGLALMEYGNGAQARRSQETLRRLGPERTETSGLAKQLRAAFGSAVQPSGTLYADSDGLRTYRLPLSFSFAPAAGLKVQGGYEKATLRSRAGSGLDRVDGATGADLDKGWGGAEVRVWPALSLRAHGGRQQSAFRDEWIYDGGASLRIGDRLRLSYDHEHGLMTISPRAVSLGLTRDADRVRASWSPSFTFFVDLDGSVERLSDENQRYALRIAPRVATVRNQWMNLDLGAAAYMFGADLNLDHGYYDPERYEAYTFTVVPYLKFNENAGLSLFFDAGVQRDRQQGGFEPGGSAAAELTLGIYKAWVVKFNGSTTINSRLESGAYRGYGAAAVLIRRF